MDSSVVIIGIVVCVVSCIIAALLWATSSSGSGSSFDFSNLSNWKPFVPQNIDVLPDPLQGPSVYGFNKYVDFKAQDFAAMGPAVSGSIDTCSSKCNTTTGCRGFSADSGSCTTYNNVTILDRKKGSTVYASGDLGHVQYLHAPFKGISTLPELSSVTGTTAEVVAACIANNGCKGFMMTGNSGHLYKTIDALDATIPGDSYMDPDKKATFIREGNYAYTETPTTTWTTPASWLLQMNGAYPVIPKSNTEWFTLFSDVGFDAGPDHSNLTGNTISVSSATQCFDACMGNVWCASVIMNSAKTSCTMRHDVIPHHFPRVDSSGNMCQPTGPPLNCACGANGLICNGFTESRDGTSGTDNTTYVKKMYPLDISCPMSCSQVADCVMSTNDVSNCNQYNFKPTNRTPSSTIKSTWLFDNYPS